MNINKFERFENNLKARRSIFNITNDHKTTFNAGELVPIYLEEILPGDTVKMDLNFVCRMSTMIKPVMDNSYIDIYFFFVPNRLIWDNWKRFWGENEDTYWTQPNTYTVPKVKLKAVNTGSIAEKMGIPIGVYTNNNLVVSALPFRAYAKIWNDWYRDENVQTPIAYATNDTTITGVADYIDNEGNPTDYITKIQVGGGPAPVNKYHDLFTSCLPSPQKGNPVGVPLSGNILNVDTVQSTHNTAFPLKFKTSQSETGGAYTNLQGFYDSTGNEMTVQRNMSTGGSIGYNVSGTNLVVNMANVQMLINDIRFAAAYQQMEELKARAGSRYTEILEAFYGVHSQDGRLQRSELLCGKHIPLNVNQVVQTSSTDATSAQGNLTGYSLTGDKGGYFTKSFTEHGILMGVACVRQEHTYQQGLPKFFSKFTLTDFYMNQFANIGEQPVYTNELYLERPENDNQRQVFGYNEAWYEYRYKPSQISGQFRNNATGSLATWHYGDFYTNMPTLGNVFIQEKKSYIDNTLAIKSTVSDQIIADFYFDTKWARELPVYSNPGLTRI